VVALATLTQRYGIALTAGILAGAVFFIAGMGAGGSLGNARSFGRRPQDVNTRIGVLLAASGIASQSLGHKPAFPISFQVFYGICLAVACLAAIWLAVRGLKPADTPQV
jgi:hypothetical protein